MSTWHWDLEMSKMSDNKMNLSVIDRHTYTIHLWHIYLHEWLIVMVNVGKYTIHGWYGIVRWMSECSKVRLILPHTTATVDDESGNPVETWRSRVAWEIFLVKHPMAVAKMGPLLHVNWLVFCRSSEPPGNFGTFYTSWNLAIQRRNDHGACDLIPAYAWVFFWVLTHLVHYGS